MPPDKLPSAVTAVILAGGRGRRMNHDDKGLLPFAGQPLIAHVIRAIAPQVDELIINCNANQDAYAAFGYPLVTDTLPDWPGPLAGILSAFEACDSEHLLSVPCDMPLLPADLVRRMSISLQKADADLCTVSDGHRLHPVVLLANRRIIPGLREFLAAGEHKVHNWLRSQHFATANFSDVPQAFINLNTPEELHSLESNWQSLHDE